MTIETFVLPYIGAAAIAAILWLGFCIQRLSAHSDATHESLSAHGAASSTQHKLLFIALVLLSLPLYVWLVFWLIPYYLLPAWLYVIAVVSYLAQLIVVVFPLRQRERRSIGNIIHLIAGATVAISMLLISFSLVLSEVMKQDTLEWVTVLICSSYFIGCLLAYLLVPHRRYFLLFENIYICAFATVVGVATLAGVS